MIRAAALVIAACAAAAHAQFTIDLSFNPTDRGNFVAVAFSPDTDEVFAYPEFGTAIDVYSRSGAFLRTLPRPGPSSNDIDLEFTSASVSIGGVTVPKGTLLVMNSENSSAETLFAVDSAGAVLASTVLTVAGQAVGGTHEAASGKFFVVDWASDVVRKLEPANGAELSSFSVAPAGSPAFDIFYGDIDSLQGTGTLFIVSSSQAIMREMTSGGTFVRDINLAPFGIASMSGLAFDDRRGEAWVCTLGGTIYRIGGFPSFQGGCPADWNHDLVVDGDDVVLFFEQWDASNADFNEDGGTDGDDVIDFFAHWDVAC